MRLERRWPGGAPAKAAIFHASAPGNASSAACRHKPLVRRPVRPGRARASRKVRRTQAKASAARKRKHARSRAP